MAGGGRAQYLYSELAEACSTRGLANIYAVVAEYSIPRRSRGTDYVCNFLLVDPSTDGMQRPVEMLLFAKEQWQLPNVQKPGDIIRLHRIKVQEYHDKPQLMGKLGGGGVGPPFAFCLFDSNPAAGTAPYQISSRTFHWDEREAAILGALRSFVGASGGSHRLAPRSEYVKTIKDVRPQTFVDVVCKVLAYGDVEGIGWRVMYVWDGTDALPFPYTFDTRAHDNEVPPELQQQIQSLHPLALPLTDLRRAVQVGEGGQDSLPLLGTALPVVVQGGAGVLGMSHPAVGRWVKLRNIGARVVAGQLQCFYTRASKWAPWQEETDAVAAYQHRLQRNEVAAWAPTDAGELLARCMHEAQPFTSLRQVLADTPSGVVRRYRVLARVTDYEPKQLADMCHTMEECGLGGPSSGVGRYVYTLKLLLEDATGQLDAILFGADADIFFAGLPACDLGADANAARQLLDALQRLVGKDCTSDGGPWVDVCLKAYYTGDDPAQQPWESRQYMICDSVLS